MGKGRGPRKSPGASPPRPQQLLADTRLAPQTPGGRAPKSSLRSSPDVRGDPAASAAAGFPVRHRRSVGRRRLSADSGAKSPGRRRPGVSDEAPCGRRARPESPLPFGFAFPRAEPGRTAASPKGQEDACPRSLEGNPATPSRFRGFGWSFSTLGAFTSEPLSKSGERPPRAAARSLHLREARGLGRARLRNARSRPGPRAPRPRPCSPGVTLQLGRAGGGNESGAPRDSGPPCRSPLPRAGPGPCPRPAGVPVAASSRDAPRRAVSSPACADGRPGFPSRPVPRLTLALKRVTCL